MGSLDTSRLKQVFGSKERFTEEDLRVLREDVGWVSHFSSKADAVEVRMTVELIDTIRRLDETSARLIKTTNALTATILGFTILGVIVAVVALFK